MNNNILVRKLWGDMRLNRSGFFSVWLVFVIGMTFYGGSYPAGKNFGDSVYRFQEQTHLVDLWYEVDSVPIEVVDTVRAVNGVQAVSGRLMTDLGLERAGLTSLSTLRLISLPASEIDVNNMVITQGQKPAADDEIAIMEAFALAQNIGIGDKLRLGGSADHQPWEVRVVGYAASSEYLIAARSPIQPFPTLSTFGVGYVPYASLAAHMGTNSKFNSISLILASGADMNIVRGAVTGQLQAYGLQLVMDRHQFPAFATLNANVSSNTNVGQVFSMIFLLGAGAIMAVLLARQVESERRAIGTLRALGYSRAEVLSYYLTFALIIAVTGAVVAIPLGYLITGPILQFFERGMVGAPVPTASNPPNWPFILFGFGLGLVMSLLAAALPAWRAATTDPGLALRPPLPSNVSGLARLQFRGLPLVLKQVIRNLLRAPGRTLGTMLGTICGLSLIVTCFVVWNVIDYNFNDYYNQRQYDFVVTFNPPSIDQDLTSRFSSIGGVTGAETGLIAPVKVELADRVYTALGIVLADNRTFTTFDTIQGAPAFSSDDGVWLGHNLSRTLRANVGDTLTVEAQGISKQVQVKGIVKQVLGAPMYVPMSLFSQWTPLGIRPVNQVYVRADPARRPDVQRVLNGLPGVVGVEDWHSTITDLQRVTAFNGNFALIFLAFGLMLTFVVLFTSISASLHERRNELAIMRMQGMSMGEIRRMVMWETAIAVGLGLLLGIVPTLQLADYVIQLYNTDVAGNLTIIYPSTWLFAVILLIVTALISQVFPLRGIQVANLGEVSKSVGV